MDTNNLRQVYRKDPPYIISYDWTDTINKLGYINLYVTRAYDSSAAEVILMSPTAFFSSPIINPGGLNQNDKAYTTSAGNENAADQLKMDKDIDFLINRTITLNGTVVVKFPGYSLYHTDDFDCYWYVKIRKWDGSSETELGTGKTGAGDPGNDDANCDPFLLEIPISDKIISKGEYLRITVLGYVTNSSNSSSLIGFYCDPEDTVSEDTDFIVSIPIKIQD